MSPVLPPKAEGKPVGRTVYLPEEMWVRLTDIADETKREDPHRKGYTRNEVVLHFLRWALEEYEKDKDKDREKDRRSKNK